MSRLFKDLMNGLHEVEAYLSGDRNGYKETCPAAISQHKIARNSEAGQQLPPDHFCISESVEK